MVPAAPPPRLVELAHAHGVATEYWDWQGRHVTVSAAAIRAVLTALGVEADGDEAVDGPSPRSSSPRGGAPCRRPWSPARGGRRGSTRTCRRAPASGSTSCSRTAPCARCRRPTAGCPTREVDGRLVGEATFEVPGDLPLGWHRLVAHLDVPAVDPRTTEATLVVTPQRLELPPAVAEGRVVGLMAQLYSVRSARVVGRRRPRRPRRPGHLGRGRARRRLRADQPAARRGAGRAGGALAVPADHPALRQPALPAGRGRARAGRGSTTRPTAGSPRSAAAARAPERRRPDRPRRRVDREDGGPAAGVRRAA